LTSRERVIKALRFDRPDRAPRDVWPLPSIERRRPDEWQALIDRYPMDFTSPRCTYGKSRRARGQDYVPGEYVDAWGSGWQVLEEGRLGEVKRPALSDWSNLADYEPPWEVLREADLSEVNRSCGEVEEFVLIGAANPFERMQFLRGTENLFLDLAYGVAEVRRLRDLVHDYFTTQVEMWAKTDVDGISFCDDWGSQQSLLVSLELWRSFFKPLYRDYCEIIHAGGKFAFFHSDGYIEPIYPDLIEIGVDAINSQLFCMDIEGLGQRHRGQVTFWGEIDRQRILPFGAPDDVRAAVQRVRSALDDGQGGLIAQCEWGVNDPLENIMAVYEEWERPL
jgi:hypothetical protein